MALANSLLKNRMALGRRGVKRALRGAKEFFSGLLMQLGVEPLSQSGGRLFVALQGRDGSDLMHG